MQYINCNGNRIAQSSIEGGGEDNEEGLQEIYDYLEQNLDYALYTDGFLYNTVPNAYDMEVNIGYFNEEYYDNFFQLELSEGGDLNFDYQSIEEEIPVLIGAGLRETYVIGSKIELTDIIEGKNITLVVQGIIARDEYRSNYYLLNSKQYYNFLILIPVNKIIIDEIGFMLQINALYDLIIMHPTEDETVELIGYIREHLGAEYVFNTKVENNEFFEEYFFRQCCGLVYLY